MDLAFDYVLCLLQHLAFCNPECRPGHGYSEVVDLDPIELRNTDLNRICDIPHDNLLAQFTQCLVLQTAKTDIALCQEVPAACRRILKF